MNSAYERIYAIIRQVPFGKVATYGQIAKLAGLSGHARQVGYALNSLTEGLNVPWHRVINARGEISKRAEPVYVEIQRELLAQEGIIFDKAGRIALNHYQWTIN